MWNPFKQLMTRFKTNRFAVALRAVLGAGQPGSWSSDHRQESEQYTGWTFVAVRAICLQAMQASVFVYDDSVNGSKQKRMQRSIQEESGYGQTKSLYAGEYGASVPLPNDHSLCKILKQPNPTQSGASFRYERVLQLQLTGTSIVWNVPNKFGKTVQRYVIPTAIATPVPPADDLPEGGYKIQATSLRHYYEASGSIFTDSGAFHQVAGKIIPLAQLQITRWPHPTYKDDGQSPVSAGARWIDSANQIDAARWAQMNNGADPSIVVTCGKGMNPTKEELEAAAAMFEQKYGGTENTGKAIFTTGEQVVALTATPREMAYNESFVQFRDAILALHGVPGIAAGISDGGSYAAFYASLKQFISLTVQPILDLLAEDDTERLAPQFGNNLTVEIEATHIDDPDILEKRLATDIQAQIIKVDELRAIRGLPPLGASQGGDQLVSQEKQPQLSPNIQENDDASHPVFPEGKTMLDSAMLNSRNQLAGHSNE
ncbi:phage portal protein [uncultured Gimesia sp.]|uniref:phage portal protein n=1 Tax=uncultured Gimesia sp. TaxID=1678688 RepID=UPI0030DA058D|tara:strand:+ start:83675 stop:85132 length:1458 start_codon:yes stop_codon:yes gene_type:complete